MGDNMASDELPALEQGRVESVENVEKGGYQRYKTFGFRSKWGFSSYIK